MSTQKLIRMANQIADFFRAYPEEEAAAGIRNHLQAFWTPRMRDAIAAYAVEKGAGLDPLVIRAVQSFQTEKKAVGQS
jgi:formate dehydrogenase subunit delta